MTNELRNLRALATASERGLFCAIRPLPGGRGRHRLFVERTREEIARGSRAYLRELARLRSLRLDEDWDAPGTAPGRRREERPPGR